MPVAKHRNNKRTDPQFCPILRDSKREAERQEFGAETSRYLLDGVLR
jgi:hypothetical protein